MTSLHGKRMVAGALISAVLVAVTTQPAAIAAPSDSPNTSSEALKQYQTLSHKAEQANEAHLRAQDDLAASEKALKTANAQLANAQKQTTSARADKDRYGKIVARFAMSSYRGGNFTTIAAAMGGKSARDMLQRAATIDVLASRQTDALKHFSAALNKAQKARTDAATARQRAQSSRNAAARHEQEIAQRKADLDAQAARAHQAYEQLGAQEKADLDAKRAKQAAAARAAAQKFQATLEQTQADGGTPAQTSVPIAVPSAAGDAAKKAVQAALSKQGSPYVWGATGPDSFDCSGLTSWAYAQAGVRLPRSSSEQSTFGKPIDRGSLQPGDLVFFYHPVSHVGMYVGNGQMVHAPTEGDVVRVAPVMWNDFVGARRP